MSSTPERQTAVERLYENEALIDNLISDIAKPVLEWAEQQILAGKDVEAVFAAVRAVNQSAAPDAASALSVAQQVLAPTEDKTTTHDQPSAPASVPHSSDAEKPAVAPALGRNIRYSQHTGKRKPSGNDPEPTSTSAEHANDQK